MSSARVGVSSSRVGVSLVRVGVSLVQELFLYIDMQRCGRLIASNLCTMFYTTVYWLPGVTRDHLSRGALEVILCDYHHFSSNQTIGGLRLCVPIKKDHHHFVYSLSSLPPPSPCHAHLSESLSPSVPDTCSE